MKNFWKWILGIVVVLVVLFALGIGARLLMAGTFPNMRGDFGGFRHPMMGMHAFSPFGGGFMPLGWLFPLLLIGLLAYGAYWLGRRNSPASQPPVLPTPTCAHCGQPLQKGWNHCPNCGEKTG